MTSTRFRAFLTVALKMIHRLFSLNVVTNQRILALLWRRDEVICHPPSGIKNDQLQPVTVVKQPLTRCQSAAKIDVSAPCERHASTPNFPFASQEF